VHHPWYAHRITDPDAITDGPRRQDALHDSQRWSLLLQSQSRLLASGVAHERSSILLRPPVSKSRLTPNGHLVFEEAKGNHLLRLVPLV
jgi:hypothetical protein